MTVTVSITRRQIQRMRSHGRMRIDRELEDMILAQNAEEPDAPEYTEQDLHEQIRKLINQYNLEYPDPNLIAAPTPWASNHCSAAAGLMKHRGKPISK